MGGLTPPVLLPAAGGILLDVTEGPDEALWYTAPSLSGGAGQIARATTAGGVQMFPMPSSKSYPVAITAGPDGAIWLADNSGVDGIGAIGRLI